MKKITIFILYSALCSTPVWAVTDQIESANNYLEKIKTSQNEEGIIIESENIDNKALAPKNEIKFGYKNKLLTQYQEQHNLTQTGKFDQETLDFVREQQELLGFNVTKTLDYNTWFATFEQPVEWQITVINKSLIEWNRIVEKQKRISLMVDFKDEGGEFSQDNKKLDKTIPENVSSNKFIVVNIPSMSLHAYYWDGQRAIEDFKTKVVVGNINNKTPLDDMYIWGLKYHPTWTPTPNMLKRNVYKSDGSVNTDWLAKRNVKAFDNKGNQIPYSELADNKDVHLYQPAGNNNALGLLKFETDSNKNIYLHDTNEKRYFTHNTRAYSSGCVRVEDYSDLAVWLNEDLSIDDFSKKMANKRTRIEKTQEKIPVYYTYSQVSFTDNYPVFHPDIYKFNSKYISYQ